MHRTLTWMIAAGVALTVIVLPPLLIVGLDHFLPGWVTWLLVAVCVAPIVIAVLSLAAGGRSGDAADDIGEA